MNNCIVTVMDVEQGIYCEWRGLRYPVRGLQSDHERILEDDTDVKINRTIQMWACNEEDLHNVIEKVSQEWAGHEIKIFNLTAVATRLVGELREKSLTKDGILPK